MSYREKMREYISCPQFGDVHYGKWGALNLEQRILIKKLLNEIDNVDDYNRHLYCEIKELHQRIDKAIEYINTHDLYIEVIDYDYEENPETTMIRDDIAKEDLSKILKGESNDSK